MEQLPSTPLSVSGTDQRPRVDNPFGAVCPPSSIDELPDLSLYEASPSPTIAPDQDPTKLNDVVFRTHEEELQERCRLRHGLDTLTRRLHGLRQKLSTADKAVTKTQEAIHEARRAHRGLSMTISEADRHFNAHQRAAAAISSATAVLSRNSSFTIP